MLLHIKFLLILYIYPPFVKLKGVFPKRVGVILLESPDEIGGEKGGDFSFFA